MTLDVLLSELQFPFIFCLYKIIYFFVQPEKPPPDKAPDNPPKKCQPDKRISNKAPEKLPDKLPEKHPEKPPGKPQPMKPDTRISIDDITMKKTFRASFHQNNQMKYGNSAGKQCTCNSMIGLIHLPNINNYTSIDLNRILDEGNELYKIQDAIYPHRRTPHLSFDELPMENITSRNTNYSIKRHNKYHCVKGRLDSDKDDKDSLTDSLDTALNNSLQLSHTLLILIGEFAICMFFAHGHWFTFDPHCNNTKGQYDRTGNGKAILIQFPDLNNARNYLKYYIQERATHKHPMVEFLPITLSSISTASTNAQKENWFENYLNFEDAKRLDTVNCKRQGSYADAVKTTPSNPKGRASCTTARSSLSKSCQPNQVIHVKHFSCCNSFPY